MKRDIQLVIPMSGIGKRFIEAGYKDPKPLIRVDGMPIIQHVVNMFPGINDVTFICNEKHINETNVVDVLREISPACKIYTVSNENRKGPVDAVNQIRDHIRDDAEIIVSYCDYGTQWNFDQFLELTKTGYYDGMIPCYTGFHPHMLGGDNYAFCKHENKKLIQIKEKEPFTDNKMNEYASNGTYYFKTGLLLKKYFKELIDLNQHLNGEFYVSLVYNLLVRDNLNVGIFEIEKMLQWGTPYDLENYKGWSAYFANVDKQQTITHNDDVTLVLPMAGNGSRFTEQGYKTPKPLLDVDGQPMVVQAVNCLPQSKHNIFICLEDHVQKWNIDKILAKQYSNTHVCSIAKTTSGQACTCELGINNFNIDLEKPILISACDNGVCYNTEKYSKLVNDNNVDVIVWSFRNNQASKNNPNMYSWLDVDDKDNINYVSCKKFTHTNPLESHAIIGTMFFRKAKYFIDGLQKNYENNIRTNNEYYVDDVINQNIKAGLNVKVFEVDNYICWGTPDDYKTYNYWKDFFTTCKWHPYKK